MPYTCSASLGPEAIYGMAVILVVGLIYFIFPVVHTVQPEMTRRRGVGWGGVGGYKAGCSVKLPLQL